jgi:hypothetical protein
MTSDPVFKQPWGRVYDRIPKPVYFPVWQGVGLQPHEFVHNRVGWVLRNQLRSENPLRSECEVSDVIQRQS